MIFNKILRGTELTFDIILEKTEYRPSEVVRGKLTLKTEKSCKTRKLTLLAEGKESTIIKASESTDYGSSRDTTTKTYSETNTFFSEDLSHFLQKSTRCNVLQDGTIEIPPQNSEVLFDFTLPANHDNLLSSYKGKHANITYYVKATADIAKRFDVNKEAPFHVFNSHNNEVLSYDSISPNHIENNTDAILPTTINEVENNYSQSPTAEINENEENTTKKNYSARFEQIFGKKPKLIPVHTHPSYFPSNGTTIDIDLGTIFAKGREHFLKENSQARIDLSGHQDKDLPYSAGQTIKGKVILLSHISHEIEMEKNKNGNIRGIKISVSGTESAFAQGLQRVSTIEKFEKKIDLNGDENGEHNDITVPFEFLIPEGIKQSYIGKYSEYFWGLEAKVNVAWSSDISARRIVEIV